MNADEINNDELVQLAKLVSEIESEKSNNPLQILHDFNVEKWSDWLEDILNYNVAYPISQISTEGDVIVDIVDYLRTNNLSVHNYEEAVGIIVNQFSFSNSNSVFLERLINVLISIRGYKTDSILLKILTSRDNNYQKGSFDFLKSIALLALARSSGINDTTQSNAYNYLKMVGLKEMKHDPSFYGNALRFSYLQYSVNHFFEDMDTIIRILDPQVFENQDYQGLNSRYALVILDKLEEVHYRYIGTFYSSFCKWFMEVGSSNSKNSLQGNPLFKLISENFMDLINSKTFIEEVHNISSSKITIQKEEKEAFIEDKYAMSLRFLLNFTQERDDLNLSLDETTEVIAFLIDTDKEIAIDFFSDQLRIHREYIGNHCGILPYLAGIKLKDLYNKSIIDKIIDLFDSSMFMPEEAQETKDVLRRNTINFIKSFENDDENACQTLNKHYAVSS